jgi:SAM-dependent methyltransferase
VIEDRPLREQLSAKPIQNGAGLCAADVLAVHDQPLFAAPGIAFDGRTLVLAGAFLPPHGDPSLLRVEFAPGVSYRFDYPLPSPEFERHFWYWPNALHAGFELRIDLSDSTPAGDPFAFDFVFPESAGFSAREVRRRVYLPSDLRSFVGFPDEARLQRAQSFETRSSVAVTGYQAFRVIEEAMHKHGISNRTGVRVLDFGCGHGRVARHFLRYWAKAEFSGADIDADNLAWCRQNLSRGDFRLNRLWPESSFAGESFDAIYGLSVMTHLTAEAQEAWLGELARILKPNGVALLSFSGDAAVAYSSMFRDADWWRNWRARGFDDAQPDPTLDTLIVDPFYLRNTLQSAADVRSRWARHFEIVEIQADVFGYQSLCVMRRRS